MLERAAGARLAYVQAPAGYGKTSLLQQWAQRCASEGATVIWMDLDARSGDPMSFAQNLLQATEAEKHPVGEPADDLEPGQNYYGWRAIIQALCDRFSDAPRPCYLFFDDAQRLKNTEALACLRMLIAGAPAEMRVVVASREDVGIPLGRLRALGELVELYAEDLQFGEDETRAYLASSGQGVLDPDQVRLLQERAEGWIVGIKLFSMALSLEPESQRVLESFTGERRQIADFFVEDVFSRQPKALQDFLLQTSVLDSFCPGMCDAVLQTQGSRALIEQCEESGLFVLPLDQTRTWYRYHHLFAGFLRRYLQDQSPGAGPQLCRRAAEWLTQAGRYVEAFDCALRGQDPFYAAQILDEHCESMFAAGMQPAVQAMAGKIPSHILGLHPRLMLILAWRLIAQWRIAEAKSLVAVAQARLREMERSTPEASELDSLRLLAAHRQSQLSHATYDIEALEGQCLEALRNQQERVANPYLMGSLYNSLQYAQREQYKLGKVDRFDALAREEVERTGRRHGEIFVAAISGPSYMLLGRMDRAEELLASGLRTAQQLAGRDDPLGSVVALALAYLHYERNEIDEAEALVTHYMPLATSAGFVDQLVFGWITQSRLQVLQGHPDAALKSLDEAAEFASRHDLDQLRIAANTEQLRVLLRLGRPDDADRFARRRGLRAHRAASLSRGQYRYTTLDGAVALGTCRLLAAEDRLGEALGLARQWRSFVSAAQAVYAAVEWDILLAELLLLSGERLAAQRALAQALPKAAPGRMVRRFLDEGEPIAGLIRQMSLTERQPDEVSEQFLQHLAACLEPVDEPTVVKNAEEEIAICGKISSREIEILALAGAGASNRDIGDRLSLTEGTVKWYLQQIFDKIGVRNRKQSVERARRLGLIP